jgi:hypothetical protein
MRNFILGLIAGIILAGCVTVFASDIRGEALWNRVFNSSNNSITIVGV